LTVRLLPADWSGMVIFGLDPKWPLTVTVGVEEPDDPQAATASGATASSGAESSTAMRRMGNLVISGSERRQPTGIT
jgi:hypothetical protein